MMRFGTIHRIFTGILASLGILCIVTSGEISTAKSIATVLGLAASLAIPEKWHVHPVLLRFGTVASIALLALQIARVALGAPFLDAAVEYAIALLILRIANRRGAAHDRQVMVLAWLLLVAGTVIGGGFAYAICFIAFLVVVPGALSLSHLRREVEDNYRQGARDRTGLPVDVPRILRSRRVVGRQFLAITCLLSLPILLFTAVFFAAFPRVGMSLLAINRPTSGRMVGFSDHVDLGEVGTLRSDPTIVIRAEVPDLPSPPPERISLYLRGTALDTYDGSSWSRSRTDRVSADRLGSMVRVRRYSSSSLDRFMSFDLDAIDPPVLFLPINTIAIRVRPRGEALLGRVVDVLQGADNEFRYLSPSSRGVTYQTYLVGPDDRIAQRLAPDDRESYVTVPNLTERVVALASKWTEGATTPLRKAQAVEAHLLNEYEYDLDSPSARSDDPLDHFLFESKKGHCEYFSTAMAILMRIVDVPTRNVTGFVGGTYNRFGSYYSIRQGDAHSWVEVYVDEQGWVRFDPTPPSGTASLTANSGLMATLRDMMEAVGKTWDTRVVRYDFRQQAWLFGGLRTGFMRTRQSMRSASVNLGAQGSSSWATTAVVLTIAGGAVTGLVLWQRSRRRRDEGVVTRKSARTPQELAATELYRALQRAMVAARIPRGIGIPPLLHAKMLMENKHPSAEAVHEVTCAYLETRFGDQLLSNAQRLRMVQLIRTVRRQARDRKNLSTAPWPVDGT